MNAIKEYRIAPKAARQAAAEAENTVQAANQEKAAPYIAQREKLGLSRRQLAEKAGVDVATVRNMESGKHWPCWETRQKLRRALGMPEERFYTEEERNEIFFQMVDRGVIQWAIRKKRQKLNAIHADVDDLYQELSLCVLRAIDRFQPDGKATLKTFVERNL